MRIIAILIGLFTSISFALGQDKFEGSIVYTYKVPIEISDMYAALVPTSMEVHASHDAVLVRIKGGMMEQMVGDIVTTPKESVMIKHGEKAVYVLPADAAQQPVPKVTKEDEVIDILGYSCQKYRVEIETAMGLQVNYLWVTDKYAINLKGGKGMEGLTFKGIEGLTLKTMTTQNDLTMVMTATSVDVKKLKNTFFEVPKGYERKAYEAQAPVGY